MIETDALLTAVATTSAVVFIASLLSLPWIATRLPEDLLVPKPATPPTARDRWMALFRNSVALLLGLAGIAMLVMPGQGLITIAVALGIAEFPGKDRLVSRVLGDPRVYHTLNRLRARLDAPPLLPPHSEE